ncbi:TonB-dependent receptor [Colwelliaceae bacterium BS250]
MKKSKLSLALLAAMAVQVPSYAFAEDVEVKKAETELTAREKAAKTKAEQEESTIEVIRVGGMRSSEVAAINMKKFADTISDNLSAEEVGALPSQSIAESLERLAGVTGNQDQGRSNTISVRGMGGAYTLTTLNDREIVSSFGSRSINLSLFPGAAVRRAQVYKTARADSLEGGIAGQVNMETFKPLEVDRNVASISASVNSNELLQDTNKGDKYGKRIEGLFSYHVNDNFAVSVGGSYREEPEYFEGLNNAEIMGGIWAPDYNQDGIDDFGTPAATLSSKLRETEQDSLFFAAQWAPTDNLVLSFDALTSTYEYMTSNFTNSNWGIGSPDRQLGDPALADVDPETNYLMSGMAWGDGVGKWDASVLNEDETQAYGFNVDYIISDDLAVNFDVSHSSADRLYSWRSASGSYGDDGQMRHYYSFDHYGDEFGFEYLGSDADGSAYDPSTYTLDQSQLTQNMNNPDLWQFNQLSNSRSTMESAVSAVKVDLTYDVDYGMVHQLKFGARYSENTKEARADDESYDENTANWDQISDVDWHARNTSLTNNPYQKLTGVKGYDEAFYFDVGQLLSDKAEFFPERVIDDNDKYASYDIEENTTAFYLQASFSGDWYDGVFGVRYYETELEATSFQSDFSVEQKMKTDPDTGEMVPDGDAWVLVPGDNPGFVTSTNKYDDVLPTLNVNLRLIDDVVIRIGLGKAMIRPSLGEINSGIQLKSPNDPEQDIEEGEDGQSSNKTLGTAGNPYLMPITSEQADISFEYYPTRWDMFALAAFYKDLDGIYETGATYIPIEGSVDKRGDEISLPMTAEQKAGGGSVSGWEFSFRQHLEALTPYLKGFALSGNYMDFYHDADQDYNRANPGQAPMWRKTELYYSPAGWLDSTYNVTLTYDYGQKFSARLNLNQQEGGARKEGNDGKYSLADESKNLSFQVTYKATEHFTVFAQAANLLDEATTYGNLSSDKLGEAHPNMPYSQSHRGVSWYAGVRANF